MSRSNITCYRSNIIVLITKRNVYKNLNSLYNYSTCKLIITMLSKTVPLLTTESMTFNRKLNVYLFI